MGQECVSEGDETFNLAYYRGVMPYPLCLARRSSWMTELDVFKTFKSTALPSSSRLFCHEPVGQGSASEGGDHAVIRSARKIGTIMRALFL